MRFLLSVLLLTFLFASCVEEKERHLQPYDLTAKVIYLKDGDSFVVLDKNKKEIEVRLIDIDAPELHQAYGKKAKMHLSNLIKGKTVGIDFEEKDKYGRILGDVYLDSLYINEEMIRAGYAWHFTRFSNDYKLQTLEDGARNAKQGLWQDVNAQAPWDWRNDN